MILFSVTVYTHGYRHSCMNVEMKYSEAIEIASCSRPGSDKGVNSGLADFALYIHTAHHML